MSKEVKVIIKRVCILVMCILVAISMIGCTNGSKDDGVNDAGVSEGTYGFNEVFVFDNLEMVFHDDYEIVVVEDAFSELDGVRVVRIPVTITNTSDDAGGLNLFYFETYGKAGERLDDVYFNYAGDAEMMIVAGVDQVEAGATVEVYSHVVFDDAVTLVFESFTQRLEVKLVLKND